MTIVLIILLRLLYYYSMHDRINIIRNNNSWQLEYIKISWIGWRREVSLYIEEATASDWYMHQNWEALKPKNFKTA